MRRLLDEVPFVAEDARANPIVVFREAMKKTGGELSFPRTKTSFTARLPIDCGQYNTCEISYGNNAITLSFDFAL